MIYFNKLKLKILVSRKFVINFVNSQRETEYNRIMEDWRDKLGAAFGAELEQLKAETPEVEAEPASWADNLKAQQGKQMVNVMLDKRNRNGKKVTLVTDLLCDDDTLKELARELKAQCGVGGSARGGEILIQGDFRDKVLAQLKARGLKARII